MPRRTLNRMEKRAEYEAYEATQGAKSEADEDLEEETEDEDDEAEASDEEDGEELGDDEEPKKKKASKAPEARVRSLTRTAKLPRLKLVWGVFNNSNQCVARYDYPKKREADEHAARLQSEKRQIFFVQPIKEPIDEKKRA